MLQTYVKADFVSLFHSLVMTPGVGLLCLCGGAGSLVHVKLARLYT